MDMECCTRESNTVSLHFQNACLVWGEEERKSIVWQSPLRDVTLKAKTKDTLTPAFPLST